MLGDYGAALLLYRSVPIEALPSSLAHAVLLTYRRPAIRVDRSTHSASILQRLSTHLM